MEESKLIENISPIPVEEKTSRFNKNQKIRILGVFIGLFTLFVLGILLTLQKSKNNSTRQDQRAGRTNKLIDGTVVYGYWTDKSSVITAFDLSTQKEAILATLPNNVKHIKILDNKSFLYINNTDQHDYGKELIKRDLNNNSDNSVIIADSGFGIDDYAVSQNGQFVALWMVGNSSKSTQFSGSPSRVYAVNMTTREKHLIYDESSSDGQTVHYPIAITNNGQLFTDRFLPNSGAGWGYGMSVSDFLGTSKKDIDSMKNGTYSTQPDVSPNGTTLAFAGYDGTDGTVNVEGFRKALIAPNTVETFNLANQTRTRIDTGLKNVIYPSVKWDQITSNLIFQSIEQERLAVTGLTYMVNINNNFISKIEDAPNLNFYGFLNSNTYLLGQQFQDDSGIGNLGAKYSPGINKFYIKTSNTANQVQLPINKAPIQFIKVTRSAYFSDVEKKEKNIISSARQLQLQTFEVKPTLGPHRITQQSDPPNVITKGSEPPTEEFRCSRQILAMCREIIDNLKKDPNYYDKYINGGINPASHAATFDSCVQTMKHFQEGDPICMDSPLYLYGTNGTKVKVAIDTAISNPNISIINNTFSAVLNNSQIEIGENTVDSVSFDYTSRIRRLLPPSSGFIFAKVNLTDGIKEIASKFGFNSRETFDILNFASSINSNYLFVSFYDHATSQNILPLYFDPIPDNYRNIVFYFKKLDGKPSRMPLVPEIVPVKRGGLTAIEISYILH